MTMTMIMLMLMLIYRIVLHSLRKRRPCLSVWRAAGCGKTDRRSVGWARSLSNTSRALRCPAKIYVYQCTHHDFKIIHRIFLKTSGRCHYNMQCNEWSTVSVSAYIYYVNLFPIHFLLCAFYRCSVSFSNVDPLLINLPPAGATRSQGPVVAPKSSNFVPPRITAIWKSNGHRSN